MRVAEENKGFLRRLLFRVALRASFAVTYDIAVESRFNREPLVVVRSALAGDDVLEQLSALLLDDLLEKAGAGNGN